MSGKYCVRLNLVSLCAFLPLVALSQNPELRSATTVVSFGPKGMTSVEDIQSRTRVGFERDGWSLMIDNRVLRSDDLASSLIKTSADQVSYNYEISGYRIQVSYRLGAKWRFVDKQIKVLRAPNPSFAVHRIVPWDLTVTNDVTSDYVPSTYVPQFGQTIEQSRNTLPGKDFGAFLRVGANEGAM